MPETKVLINLSNRHIHVSAEDLEARVAVKAVVDRHARARIGNRGDVYRHLF